MKHQRIYILLAIGFLTLNVDASSRRRNQGAHQSARCVTLGYNQRKNSEPAIKIQYAQVINERRKSEPIQPSQMIAHKKTFNNQTSQPSYQTQQGNKCGEVLPNKILQRTASTTSQTATENSHVHLASSSYSSSCPLDSWDLMELDTVDFKEYAEQSKKTSSTEKNSTGWDE